MSYCWIGLILVIKKKVLQMGNKHLLPKDNYLEQMDFIKRQFIQNSA